MKRKKSDSSQGKKRTPKSADVILADVIPLTELSKAGQENSDRSPSADGPDPRSLKSPAELEAYWLGMSNKHE